MKLETLLQPNCSESIVSIVDWENRVVVESFESSNQGIDMNTVVSLVQKFVKYKQEGYAVNVEDHGEDFTQALDNVAQKIVDKKIEIEDWDKLGQYLLDNDPNTVQVEAYEDRAAKFVRLGKNKRGGK